MATDVVHVIVLQSRLDGALHLQRRAHANRVGHIHALHADTFHQARQVSHPLWCNLALIRASYGTAHGPAHRDARSQCCLDHRRKTFDAFGDGAVDVFLAESLAGGAKNHNLIRLVQYRRFVAFEVRREN